MGFEAMPQIADLEIAATWDEIELEAALRSRGADASDAPCAETPSASLVEALRAIEALKQLPRDERKRRAEELLHRLTSAVLPAPSAAPEPTPESSEPTLPEESPSEVAPVAVEAPPTAEEPLSTEPAEASIEVPEPATAEPPSAEPIAVAAETAPPQAEDQPADALVAVALDSPPSPSEAPLEVESAEALPEISQPAVTASPEPVLADATPGASDPVAVDSEPMPMAADAAGADAPAIAEPAPDTAASAPVVEPVAEVVPEPSPMPAVSREPDAIPKFLTTECAAVEPEQPDSLIPFRTAAAAGALIGAVLLVYFWSSQEFGVAARPILGASETAQAHALVPRMSASLAARQAFVALPPDFATGPQPPRPYRPRLVGFDFFDDPAPASAITAKAETAATASQAALVVSQASTEETAAMPPPSPGSAVSALIKRGDDLLKAGDIAAARSAYERAAAGGNAKAQIGVGRTYDPLVLAKLGARGVRGDPVQAAAWYARAGEAGDEEGQQSLHALISGLSDCMLARGNCATRKP